ncbi:hypothetical protein [Sporomusa sp.]|uniref:hypothetical protein n=1 Tax=Sporomusa sp. TaxID=2078658 RepID=UPI002CB69EA4|nr:hypothetical protein [Sporomusa sp.]HWR44609.1 hypothetical protein [Sporomusa sp.]
MSLLDQEDDFLSTYEQQLQDQINQVDVNDAVMQGDKDSLTPIESPRVTLNSATTASKPPSPLVWNMRDMTAFGSSASANSLYNFKTDNFSFYPDAAHGFMDKWRYNFDIILGPNNIAFIDATLSHIDIALGFHLEYNPNGILWRVSSSGLPHPDDLDKYIVQNQVIEGATELTTTDAQSNNNILGSSTAAKNETDMTPKTVKAAAAAQGSNISTKKGTGGGSEADSERAKWLILEKGSYNIGPGSAINAAFSSAIYYDGSQKIPDGFRSIGNWWNKKTDYYAEYFTDDKQIVVVFRGTPGIISKAFFDSDIKLMFKEWVPQFADVEITKQQVEDLVAANPELQGLPISATGHSLGGANAQYFTYISQGRYPSETFGAPGIVGSLLAGNKEVAGVNNLLVINNVNIYDPVGTSEFGGHVGAVRKYDMHPNYFSPDPTSEWATDNWLIEHSINTYQSYFG